MKKLPKNYSLPDNIFFLRIKNWLTYLVFVTFCSKSNGQIINYVSNGGFEDVLTNTSTPLFYSAKYWGATDSVKYYGELLSKTIAPIKVPLCGYTYQWPRHGNNHLITTPYSTHIYNNRGYPRNRLKQSLKSNKAYCFSMYVNLSNQSTYGIGAIGAYFADTSIDTISKCTLPITYLAPQVENANSTIIADTLNWILIRGQFTASGNEKYLVIGNFRSDVNTNKTLVNSTNLPGVWSDYLIDDVSLIELNIPAYAGRDTVIFAGDSVFLGSKPDVGIDEVCQWYKLPLVITPTTPAIDTVAGFWVKPTATSTYVVRQEICGLVKWDTVVVYMDAVGIEKFNLIKNDLKLFPNPAQDILQVQFTVDVENEFKTISIYNKLGQLLREEDLIFKNKTASIKTDDLRNGVYVLKLHSMSLQTVSRRFIINR